MAGGSEIYDKLKDYYRLVGDKDFLEILEIH